MVGTGLIENFVASGVFGPGLFVRRILYTQSHMIKYSLNMYLTAQLFAAPAAGQKWHRLKCMHKTGRFKKKD
jgi:hypothetical protein